MTNSKANYISLKELMKLAVNFEFESAEYYRNMQKYKLGQSAHQLAELLEKQEMAHKKILEEYDLSGKEGYIQFPPDFSLILPVLEKSNPSLDEFIEVALQREIKSREIYNNALKFTSGDLKELLAGLVNFEQEHVERLQSLKNNL